MENKDTILELHHALKESDQELINFAEENNIPIEDLKELADLPENEFVELMTDLLNEDNENSEYEPTPGEMIINAIFEGKPNDVRLIVQESIKEKANEIIDSYKEYIANKHFGQDQENEDEINEDQENEYQENEDEINEDELLEALSKLSPEELDAVLDEIQYNENEK